ncbi:MAG: hypothetical protein HY720_00220 [Planctomycetes bacterium]|nr:hypothetical protein [Planctomycetota bacterium]
MTRVVVMEVHPGLRKYRRAEYTVFTIEGENTFGFQKVVRDHILAETGNIAVHVRALKMINSGFVGLLMFLYKEVSRTGRRFILYNPNQRLRDLILVMGLDRELVTTTGVEDLPPSTLGFSLDDEGDLGDCIHSYRVQGFRILSIEGRATSLLSDRLRALVQEDAGNVAIHIGALEALDSTFFETVLDLHRRRAEAGRDLPLLNPSIEFHGRLRKEGVEQRMTIVTALDQLVKV